MGKPVKALDRWRAELAADARKAFTWAPPMNLVEWSETIRRMDGGRAFRYSFAPYQREIAETIHSPDVQMVAMMMASRQLLLTSMALVRNTNVSNDLFNAGTNEVSFSSRFSSLK